MKRPETNILFIFLKGEKWMLNFGDFKSKRCSKKIKYEPEVGLQTLEQDRRN